MPALHLAPQLCWASSAPCVLLALLPPRLAAQGDNAASAGRYLLSAFTDCDRPLAEARGFIDLGRWVRSSCFHMKLLLLGSGFPDASAAADIKPAPGLQHRASQPTSL